MIPWWGALAWTASVVAAYFGGALSYHWVRMLASRAPMYKVRYPDQAKMKEKAVTMAADKYARDLQTAHMNGLQLTREDYVGELGPDGPKK